MRKLVNLHRLAIERRRLHCHVHGLLHRLLQRAQPILYIALGTNWPVEWQSLTTISLESNHLDRIVLVELNRINRIKDGWEMRLDRLWIGALREDLDRE